MTAAERAALERRRIAICEQGDRRLERELKRYAGEITKAQLAFHEALDTAKDERQMHAAVAVLNVELAALRGVEIRRG